MTRALPLAVALLSLAVPLAGQEPETRASEPIPIDSIAFEAAAADTVPVLAPRFREGQGARVLAAVPSEDLLPRNPRNAAIRSFLFPGWGQWYAGHPLRGVIFATAEIGFAALGYRKQRQAIDKKNELRAARDAFFADPPEDLPEDPILAEERFDQTVEALTIRADLDQIQGRREDYYAYAVLSAIFGAVDAYVSTQLDPIRVGTDPNSRRVWVGLRLPVEGVP